MKEKIFIVEDEALIAEEIKSTLKILGYSIAGHSMNGDKALDKFASSDADLYLLDINIKGSLSGIELADIIRTKYKKPFIFLTSFSDSSTLNKAKDTMPYGYILKPFNEHDLKVNIELALFKYNSENAQSEFSKSYVENKLNIRITDREFSVLEAFKNGLTYKETGHKLFISTNTVKSYQKKLFAMLEVKSKFELLKKIE